MKFRDFISDDAIRHELAATDKHDAIRELVAALAESDSVAEGQAEAILAKIMEREELGSTGIGRGVAVPHARHEGVPAMVGAVGLCPSGIDFDSLDGDPVRVVFLLVSPVDQHKQHIATLEHICSRLRDETFRRFLLQAESVADVRGVLDDADAAVP